MHKQLSLFQNAITAYFAGNKNALENYMKEFPVKIRGNEREQTLFLEHWFSDARACHSGM